VAIRPKLPLVCGVLLAIGLAGPACRRETSSTTGRAAVRGGELVASLRSAPRNYNRYFELSAPGDLVSLLTQARLVRVNRATDALEPALAESWQQSSDGAYILRLRPGLKFSDGVAMTAADVLFSFAVAYDEEPRSVLGPALKVAGKPLEVSSPDPQTIAVRFPQPFAPGIRMLDILPILPKHKLESAFNAGTIENAWTAATPLSDIVGLGPFVMSEDVAGQRMVFTRNPHYWRRADDGTQLPYLDKLTVEFIPEQNAEALRLESGATDLMSNADIRPDDYARFKTLTDQGRLKLLDVGVAIDPNLLWFNLKPAGASDPKPWLRTKEFRQALSYGVDRQAFANTVFLGAGVPVFGPVTSGNRTWYSSSAPTYSFDTAKARQLLAAAGLTDKDGDGQLEDANRRPVRFSVLVQSGHTTRERSVAVLQEQFRRLGVGLDVVGLDPPAIIKRWLSADYDSIYHGFQASSTDPAMSLDFWLSSGTTHFWNPNQNKPATEWEARIDDLMQQQIAASDLAERQKIFAEVQRVFGEHLPAIYFAAPKVTVAFAPRVTNVTPANLIPQLLWSADTLAVTGPRGGR
jgi:peptide/nickel transport system substrate-binding protein